jgi:hypothetical protein
MLSLLGFESTQVMTQTLDVFAKSTQRKQREDTVVY